MDPKQFTDKAPGQVVQAFDPKEGPYWTFVPNPLPPKLKFDSELVKAVSSANLALGELGGLGRTILNPNLLINPFIRREAELSSKIEGTRTQIEDLYVYEATGQLEIPGIGKKIPEDVLEVANYVKAMEYGLQRLKDFPLAKRFVRELHEMLLKGVRGQYKLPAEFRQKQNFIGSIGDTLSQATFVPPPVDEMHKSLDEFEKYLHQGNDPYPPLVRLALIHYQFEAIHPFRDGNGRIGRLLISLLLVHWNLLSQPLLYLSAYFEKNRQEYYDHLMAISTHGAWKEWLVFFLKGVTEQSKDAIWRAKALQDLQKKWQEHCRQIHHSDIIRDVIDLFFLIPFWTVPEIEKYLGRSYRGIQNNIDVLEKEGLIREITGRNYGKLYRADGVIEIVLREVSAPQ